MKGRTYRYYTEDPLIPFGFGLSYTKFEYSELRVPSQVTKGHDVNVEVTVANTGLYDADEVVILNPNSIQCSSMCLFEVVQVYISWSAVSFTLPRWQLVAFDRVTIPKGQKQKLTLTIAAADLEVWKNHEIGFDIVEGRPISSEM
jgi:beta-glucosidase